MTRSKDIGTRTETQVVNYLRANGFPAAERRALHGNQDLGDILVVPGKLIAEVKGGAAAENASDEQLRKWCEETATEVRNAEVSRGFLVVKRKGHGVAKIGGWWVVFNDGGMLIRYRLDEFVSYLVSVGYNEGLN